MEAFRNRSNYSYYSDSKTQGNLGWPQVKKKQDANKKEDDKCLINRIFFFFTQSA